MRMRLLGLALAIAAVHALGLVDARAQNRYALVIGINDYQNVVPLQKAVGDAQAMQDTLQRLGFQVAMLANPDRRRLNAAISAFVARIQPGDVALVHYSGHGVQLDGENFLLPADTPAPSGADKEFLKSEAIPLSVLIDRVKAAGARTQVFIIDACRSNPYAAAGTRGMGGTRGLSAIAPPKGTFVMFSAGQGQEALDRLSDDDREPTSLYTRTLRARMQVEGLAITDLARAVRDDVEATAASVNHEQRPAYYDELSGGPFYFVPPKGQIAALSPPASQAPRAATARPGPLPPSRGSAPGDNGTLPAHADAACRDETQLRSVEGLRSAVISFRNDGPALLRIYWIDYTGQRKLYGELASGQRRDQSTYLTHPWVVTDAAGICLGVYLPQEQPREYVLR